MTRRTKTALGVDLGDRYVGIALVEEGPQGFRTLAAAGENLSAAEPEQPLGKVLSRLLAQLGRRAHVRNIRAAVAVSSDPLVVRLLDLPEHVPTNVGVFVANELQQYVALSGKTIVSDFCGVGTGVQKRLLAAAGDADCLHKMVKACSAAGIRVDVVEPALLTYVRAYLEHAEGARRAGRILIALLGDRALTLGLLRQGTLEFVRTRDLPADTNTPRLLCPWLAGELKAVLCYGDAHAPRADGEWQVHVVLNDGRNRTDEITPLLAVDMGNQSCTVVDACGTVTGPGFAKEDRAAPEVSRVAEGAALTLLGVEEDNPKINLLPKAVTEARSLSRHLRWTASLCVLVLLGVFAAAQLLTRTTDVMGYRIERSRLSEELYAAPALFAREKFLEQEIARLRQRVDPLRQAMKDRRPVDWPGIFEVLRQAAPAEVSVTQWHCGDGRTLSVKGFTSSCSAAEAFVRKLEGQPPFSAVLLATVQRQPEGSRFEYRIDCTLTAKGGSSS